MNINERVDVSHDGPSLIILISFNYYIINACIYSKNSQKFIIYNYIFLGQKEEI